jgi:outer membrane protein assembly factor BamD
LFELASCYEHQAELLRRSKLAEAAKAPLIKQYTNYAADAYDRILTRYPLEDRAADARKKLEAMGRPIPKATPEAIAQDKKEQESRSSLSTYGRMMLNFKKGPDVSQAATVGEPTLVDPKQSSAPDIVRSATASMLQALNAATNANAAPSTRIQPATGDANSPRTDAPSGTSPAGATEAGSSTTLNSGLEVVNNKPAAGTSVPTSTPALAPTPAPAKDDNAIPELGNDLAKPTTNAADGTAPPLPPMQVNDAPKAAPPSDVSPASANAGTTQATAADPSTESSSKKKKKKHLLVF